jgi:hypothetical protein
MAHLVSTCREGGLLNALIRQLHGCLNVSVLVSNRAESEILVIITSLEAAIEATGSPMGMFIFDLLERMSKRCRNLGLFSFPVSLLEKAQMTAPLNSIRQLPFTNLEAHVASRRCAWRANPKMESNSSTF